MAQQVIAMVSFGLTAHKMDAAAVHDTGFAG
jgi:hypothetical protein